MCAHGALHRGEHSGRLGSDVYTTARNTARIGQSVKFLELCNWLVASMRRGCTLGTMANTRSVRKLATKPREIVIAVGLAWPTRKAADARYALSGPWLKIQKLLKQAARGAETITGTRVGVRRLRARAGGCVLHGISTAINEADVLVFDLTPKRARSSSPCFNSNVMIELGIARGKGKPCVLISSDPKLYGTLPSDLAGQIVLCYRESKRQDQQALRSTVQAFAVEAFRSGGGGKTNTEIHGS